MENRSHAPLAREMTSMVHEEPRRKYKDDIDAKIAKLGPLVPPEDRGRKIF